MLHVGIEQPERGEQARCRRDDDLANAKGLSHPACEQWAVTAEGEEGELPWVASPLRRYRLDGPDHVGGSDLVRAEGRGLEAQAQRPSDLGLECQPCFLGIEPRWNSGGVVAKVGPTLRRL